MFRSYLKTTTPVLLGAVLAAKKTPDEKELLAEKLEDRTHYKCRPSDLPLYTPLHAYNKPKKEPHSTSNSPIIESIENSIGTVRAEIMAGYHAVASQKQSFTDVIETGKEHSKFVLNYLNEPDHTMPRLGAIAIGGLSGFIFALRGGFIRRLVFTGIGAGAIASICYPEEAGKYGQRSLVEAKKNVTVAYNFVFGIKPSDDVSSRNFTPKLPTFTDISESISDLAKSAKDTLWSSKK